MPQIDEDPDYPGDIMYPQFYTTPYPKYAPSGLALWGNIRLRQQGPELGLEIPQEIYEKAGSHNDELTESERTLFLSRGDAIGKALAYPKSLTLAEKYEAMDWMSLDELHAAIRQVSGGTISQALELMAKAKASLQSLNFDEIMLLADQFRADQNQWFRRQQFPGNSEACRLITAQEGIDNDLFYQVQVYLMDDPELRKAGHARYLVAEENGETGLCIQMYEPYGFRQIPAHVLEPIRYPSPLPRREMTPEPWTKDLNSSGHFVPTRRDGVDSKLFMRDLMRENGAKKPLSDVELSDQYHALPAEDQSEYEARAETVRLAAWDQWEQGVWPQLSTLDLLPEPDWERLDKLALPREQETPEHK
ncbi:hypothetical protein PG984_015290 [Apiospora sp. TS-2023a]